MGFIKNFFASLLAMFVFAFICGIVLIGLFVALLSSAASTFTSETQTEGNVLAINLEGEITDHSTDDVYSSLLGEEELSFSLESAVAAIHAAKTDDNIKGIYIKSGILSCGYATLEELRTALADFKTSGKPIISYSGSYTQGGYYISSVADSVFMNPMGVLDLRGIASSSVFYKHLLDTLGVEMQVIKAGTYKSFTEKYTNDTMSLANREQTQRLVESVWQSVAQAIASSRNITVERLNEVANGMVAFLQPQEVANLKLVDALRYNDEVMSSINTMFGLPTDEKPKFISVIDYAANMTDDNIASNKVAVLYAEGEIDNASTSGISSSEIVKNLDKIAKDDDVKAVVLRVNSPGGSAYGAEQMWHAVEKLKKEKPVVVSMGDYAASGGYYMSAGANYIFADEKTITGSIGVFCVIPNAKKLVDKIGVSQEIVKTHSNSDLLSNFIRPLTDEEKDVLQSHVNEVYNVFISRCSNGRGMTDEAVRQIAEGRVWSGTDAVKIGLVDKIGNLDDAVSHAATLANIGTDYKVAAYPEPADWWEQLKTIPNLGYEKIFGKMDALSNERKLLDRLQRMDRNQAIMPFAVEIK